MGRLYGVKNHQLHRFSSFEHAEKTFETLRSEDGRLEMSTPYSHCSWVS